MITNIKVSGLKDYKSLSGKVFSGDIDVDLWPGKLNEVDPRVIDILNFLGNSLQLNSWSTYERGMVAGIGDLKFKDPEDFIEITISYGSYIYHVMYDSGYYTESNRICIFSESINTAAGNEIANYNYLDELWEGNKSVQPGRLRTIPLDGISWKNGLQMTIDAVMEFRNSFIIADWSSRLNDSATLRTVRDIIQSKYGLEKEYIHGVWSKLMPNLGLNIDRVDGDTILVGTREGSLMQMPLDCCGSGAIMLFRALPLLMLDDRTVVINNSCSKFCELHPVLREALFEQILFGNGDAKNRMILIRDTEE